MVVFTCGHCGESVTKPKVEKHYMTKCRNRSPNLSCMDCFKDFLGNDYETHTKCITEEERYSGKGFQAKEKKGEKKQNAWVEMLQSVLDEQKTAPSNVLRIIETISKHNNTPRKKPKFINFVKNVCGHKTNAKDVDQAWDLISVKLAELATVTNQKKPDNETKTNGTADKTQNDSANSSLENGDAENGDGEGSDQNEPAEESSNKKLSKKERKEEKKRKKYEAELQSAEAQPEETEPTDTQTKKGKKKKNKSISESVNGEDNVNVEEGKGKNKKRKRLDTCVQEAIDAAEDVPPVVVPAKEKSQKKKLKVEEEDLDQESETLHNQNVAKIEELSMKSDKFDWHAVIISVLEKKDNEMPFKRLQKKVLAEYMEATGRDVDDRIADKFIKKLKSAPKVRVDKNRVTLEV